MTATVTGRRLPVSAVLEVTLRSFEGSAGVPRGTGPSPGTATLSAPGSRRGAAGRRGRRERPDR
ncbi:hypothetical protein GCM10009756_24810 [Pseudokineococcus marinus]